MDEEEAIEVGSAEYDMLPERKLLIGMIPGVGGPIAAYLQDRRDRIAKRAAEFQVAMIEQTRMSPEAILEKIAGDERLEELFWFAMDAATRTRLERKRRAAGRIFAYGLVDDAAVNEAEYCLRALDGLEYPELTVLLALGELAGTQGGTLPGPVKAGRLKARLGSGDYGESLFQTVLRGLENEALIQDTVIGGSNDEDDIEITAFGYGLYRWLREDE